MPKSDPQEKRAVQKQILQGLVTTVGVFAGGYCLVPIHVPPDAGLVWVLRWQTLPVSLYLFILQKVAFTRLNTTAIDPINGQTSVTFQVDCKVLQNTLEQLVLHVSGQLILSTYLRREQLKLIPIASLFFLFSRLAFWRGYRRSYIARAFGMACTGFPIWAAHLANMGLFLYSLAW